MIKITKIYLLVTVLFFAVCQLQAELVGHWKFDNPADIGYDSSGMNNHGSIAAGTPLYSTDSSGVRARSSSTGSTITYIFTISARAA